MQQLTILNTREVKKIKEALEEQFGAGVSDDAAWLLNEKQKLFIVRKDISRIDLKRMRIDKYGLYFGELMKDGLRVSMEGAFLIKGKKNIVELSDEEVKEYFEGVSLEKDLGKEGKYVLLKFAEKIIGCAKYKEGKILNYLPKIHRGEVIL